MPSSDAPTGPGSGAAPAPAPGAAALPAVTLTVTAVTSYQYLGYNVTVLLDPREAAAAAAASISAQLARSFAYNSTLGGSDAATWAMFVRSALSPHLLAFVPLDAASIAAIDKAIRGAARAFFMQPRSCPADHLAAAAGLPSGYELVLRARLSLLLSLLSTRYVDTPAAALLRALDARQQGARKGVPPPWHTATLTAVRYWVERGVPWTPPAGRGDIPRCARAFARDAAAAARAAAATALAGHRAALSSVRPAHGPPAVAAADHALVLHNGLGAAGPSTMATKLSYTGPGGSGALYSLATIVLNRRALSALLRASLGALALRTLPLAPRALLLDADAGAAAFSAAAHGAPCPLCGSPAADPFHAVTECPHAAVAAHRRELTRSVARYLPLLAELVAGAAAEQSELDAYRAKVAHHGVLMALLAGPVDWDSPSGHFLLFRLVTAQPWPAACVDDPSDAPSVARALGALFDSICARRTSLHRVANSWVGFASRALRRACGAWGEAVDALLLH